jgi:hypothetical protein
MPKKISEVDSVEQSTKEIKETSPIKKVLDPQGDLSEKALAMKINLEKQPKVSVLIPLEKGEKRGATQPFCLNSYHFTVPKGTMTQVPEQIADMIAERFNIELDVRGRSLDQRDNSVREALLQ